MSPSLSAALKFLSLPNACPLCIVALDPQTGRAIAVNSTFESILGPLYKFKEWEFANAASEDVNPNAAVVEGGETNRSRFREAIDKVRTSLCDDVDAATEKSKSTAKVRDVEMLTLGTNDAGLPIRKYFDWTIGSVQLDEDAPSSAVMLYGDMINEAESSNR
jgi:hypothetical protein